MNILFRTNFNNKIGIGHAIRCNRLAIELSNRGHKCYFFFDNFDCTSLVNFKSFPLYKKKISFNERTDARIFCNETKKFGKGYVVVDDYRLGFKWEKFVSRFHKKIIILDDLNNKRHFSDYIINYNPINFPEIKYNFSLNKKRNCNFLIHPKYNVLSKKKIFKNFTFEKNKFYVTFYLGGGGNLMLLSKILLDLVNRAKIPKNIKFLIILGTIAKNKKIIINLSKKYKSITYFDQGENLYYVIKNSNLFFGTSGTAIFETAYLKTPAILFKVSRNQDTNIFSLENLGHYLFLDIKDLKKTNKITELILLAAKNHLRLKLLNRKPRIKIDNRGSSRIINQIFSGQKVKREKVNSKNEIILKGNLRIRKINDEDINHYLYCRNLKINRKMSSNSKIISNLDHYNWWFNTKRNSYVLLENGRKILYFYDEEVFSLYKKKYFLSGCFVCENECSVRHILFILNWQRNLRKNVTWVSFVKKTNLLAVKYSKYVRWQNFKKKNSIMLLLKRRYKLDINKFIFYK